MNINKVQLAGNIVRATEMRTTISGTSITSFSLAVNRNWKDKQGEKQKATEFVNCISWGKLAEVIHQYTVIGQNIYVEGRLETSSYQDKSGVKKYTTKVVVSEMQFGQKPKEYEQKSNVTKEDIPVIKDEPKKLIEDPVENSVENSVEKDEVKVVDIKF